ncbi:MAG TPA: 3-hydroxyacyl-CoA dehydrogenase NAD-binding domain-containing protein, partial [Mycobacterium sp.]|nr:3-hydroxyacyl-CoA dehydrogenase NAD-binding domain-containing protein [Mycobacterium sp.]
MADNTIQWDKDGDGIVTLTLDDPSGSANVMNEAYIESMGKAVDRLVAEKDSITGVVITSAKKTFFAGGDLTAMINAGPEDAGQSFDTVETVKKQLRTLETLGKPVVAAINGAALGGGLEIALACHHRIAADVKGSQLGLPEVTLGLLPGGGGVTRTVRMLGIQNAFVTVLAQGTRFKPAKAKEIGLVDEVLPTVEELVPAAKAWIKANPDSHEQPWDKKGYKMPGGTPASPALAAILPSFPSNLRKQLKGAPMPAPRAILAAAVEGAQVDFDTATRIESRYFAQLVTGQVAKNMIQAFFFDLQHINSGGSRPDGIGKTPITKIGVLGAGMMGAGIAYVSAKAGFEVVLKDVSAEAAAKGKAYSEKLEAKALQRGRTTEEKSKALLDRITPTGEAADLAGVDFVIEAVFENQELKHKVFQEIEDVVEPNALLGSNTSTLPITGLATGVKRQEDFVGIHFFSPVDKMPLVEIIKGEKTSDEALARVFDYTLAIGKTPIVVNDSRGFFTSRVIGTFVNEALAMLGEGVEPASIEQAGSQAGYPAPPLQLSDELNLELMHKIAVATRKGVEDAGGTYEPHPAEAVVEKMIDIGRPSRLKGAGFYEYVDGKRTRLWPGLRETFKSGSSQPPLQDMI